LQIFNILKAIENRNQIELADTDFVRLRSELKKIIVRSRGDTCYSGHS